MKFSKIALVIFCLAPLVTHAQDDYNPYTSHQHPLHLAAYRGDLAIMKQLLAQGYDVNSLDERGRTPLICACNHIPYREWQSVITLLVNFGALEKINHQDMDGVSALLAACHSLEPSNLELVKFLIENGADVNAQGTISREEKHQSALLLVCKQKWDSSFHGAERLDFVKLLVENGATISRNVLMTEYVRHHRNSPAYFYLLEKASVQTRYAHYVQKAFGNALNGALEAIGISIMFFLPRSNTFPRLG